MARGRRQLRRASDQCRRSCRCLLHVPLRNTAIWRTPCGPPVGHTAFPLLLLTCEARFVCELGLVLPSHAKRSLPWNWRRVEIQVVAVRWCKLQNELSLAPLEEVATSSNPCRTKRRIVTQSLLRELAASEGRRIGHAERSAAAGGMWRGGSLQTTQVAKPPSKPNAKARPRKLGSVGARRQLSDVSVM